MIYCHGCGVIDAARFNKGNEESSKQELFSGVTRVEAGAISKAPVREMLD